MTKPALTSRNKLFSLLAMLLAVFVGLVSANSAVALGNLDQQATGTSTRWYYIMNNVALGQDFTAGASGALDRFTIDGFAFSNPTAPLVATVFAADGSGFPTGSALASASVAQTGIPTTVSSIVFDFGSPATVNAGVQYSIVLSTSGSGEYHFENAATVPIGAKGIKPGSGNVGWQNYVDSGVTPNQTSFRFATYVTPVSSPTPSPSTTTDPALANTGIQKADVFPLAGSGMLLLLAGAITILFGRKTASVKN
jgi:hypothetical protein